MSEPADERYCPRCGAAYDPTQEYCLECGTRLPTNRGVVGVLAAAWQRRFAWYPGDWIWPTLLFLVVTIAATAAALAANAARTTSPSTQALTSPPVAVGPGATQQSVPVTSGPSTLPTPTQQPTITTGPLPTAPGSRTGTTPVRTTPSTNGVSGWPAGKSGYTLVLESLPLSGGRAAALARARSARANGLPQVGVLVSSQYSSLHPGYYVVFSGIYGSAAEASSALANAHAHGFPDAYQTRVTR